MAGLSRARCGAHGRRQRCLTRLGCWTAFCSSAAASTTCMPAVCSTATSSRQTSCSRARGACPSSLTSASRCRCSRTSGSSAATCPAARLRGRCSRRSCARARSRGRRSTSRPSSLCAACRPALLSLPSHASLASRNVPPPLAGQLCAVLVRLRRVGARRLLLRDGGAAPAVRRRLPARPRVQHRPRPQPERDARLARRRGGGGRGVGGRSTAWLHLLGRRGESRAAQRALLRPAPAR